MRNNNGVSQGRPPGAMLFIIYFDSMMTDYNDVPLIKYATPPKPYTSDHLIANANELNTSA